MLNAAYLMSTCLTVIEPKRKIIEIARKEKTIGKLYFVVENVIDFITLWCIKTSNKHSKCVYIKTNLLQELVSLLFFLFSPLGFIFGLQKT